LSFALHESSAHHTSFLSQKFDALREGSSLQEGENQKDSASSVSAASVDAPYEFKHRRSSSKWNEELSPSGSTITESNQAGELISCSKLPMVCSTMFCFILLFCYLYKAYNFVDVFFFFFFAMCI
jgi:hypothetical protein